ARAFVDHRVDEPDGDAGNGEEGERGERRGLPRGPLHVVSIGRAGQSVSGPSPQAQPSWTGIERYWFRNVELTRSAAAASSSLGRSCRGGPWVIIMCAPRSIGSGLSGSVSSRGARGSDCTPCRRRAQAAPRGDPSVLAGPPLASTR